MKRFGLPIVFLGSLLLLSGYVMTRGLMPDPQFHRGVLGVLLRSFLADARVQREVLQAQAGVPANYDTLNEQIASLRNAGSKFRAASAIASGENVQAIEEALQAFNNTVAIQEDLVERFKSASALVQNSERIFTYAAGQFEDPDVPGEDAAILPSSILRLAVAVSNFADHPDRHTESAARLMLAEIEAVAALQPPDDRVRTLTRHAKLLIDIVPLLNELTAGIERLDLYNAVAVLRSRYLDAYAERERTASRVQFVLLASALVLGAYAFLLLLRLVRGTRRLEQRLALERAASAISGRFLSLPWKRTAEGVTFGLQQLTLQIGGDAANMLLVDDDRRVEAEYHWPETAEPLTVDEARELFRRASIGDDDTGFLTSWTQGGILRSRALLRFSLRGSLSATGYIVLTVDGASNGFEPDDRALFGLVAEIFRSALERSYREKERQTLQTELSRAQRLEALGTLAGSVAHEFNNILGAVRGHAELASERLGFADAAQRNVEQILAGIGRAQGVIDKVLTFGRRRSDHKRPFDATLALTEALALLRASIPPAVEFRLAAAPGIVLAGDVTEFHQIVLNLCNNAVHAIDGAGDVAVRFATVDLGEPRRLSQGTLPPGRHALLEVVDQGAGIPPAVLESIFDPFFTTKTSSVGTGLGLSTVRDIVLAWEGGIDVASTPDVGTAMRVFLPLASAAGAQVPKPGVARGRGETVLFVEPDRRRLERDEEMIAALGYEPVGFADASAALAAFRASPDRFGIAILAGAAARADGAALPRAMTGVRRDFPVLVMVGADEDCDVAEMRDAGIRARLAYPLRMPETADALADHVRRTKAPA